jgi:hypothetical protein
MEGVGITNNQNHSVRNVEKYPRYRDDVVILNKALKGFVHVAEPIFNLS